MTYLAPVRLLTLAVAAMLAIPASAQSGAQINASSNDPAQNRVQEARRKNPNQEQQEQVTRDTQRASLFTPEERKTLRDDIRQASKVIYSTR